MATIRTRFYGASLSHESAHRSAQLKRISDSANTIHTQKHTHTQQPQQLTKNKWKRVILDLPFIPYQFVLTHLPPRNDYDEKNLSVTIILHNALAMLLKKKEVRMR